MRGMRGLPNSYRLLSGFFLGTGEVGSIPSRPLDGEAFALGDLVCRGFRMIPGITPPLAFGFIEKSGYRDSAIGLEPFPDGSRGLSVVVVRPLTPSVPEIEALVVERRMHGHARSDPTIAIMGIDIGERGDYTGVLIYRTSSGVRRCWVGNKHFHRPQYTAVISIRSCPSSWLIVCRARASISRCSWVSDARDGPPASGDFHPVRTS